MWCVETAGCPSSSPLRIGPCHSTAQLQQAQWAPFFSLLARGEDKARQAAVVGESMQRRLVGEAATAALGAELALFARPGLALLLKGELGAGKSTLARALIRALAPDAGAFDVPSPTFTLVQSYDQTRVPVAHADLYRIREVQELDELGLDDLLATHLLIVEWPDRLPEPPGPDWIEVTLLHEGETRTAHLHGQGAGAVLLARMEAAQAFLAATAWNGAARRHLQGDASYRRYERLTRGRGETAVLVDMPDRPPEPPLRDGRSYSDIARRAEGLAAVVAVNRHLIEAGYSAPTVYERDLSAGMALVEDFGDSVYGAMIAAGADMAEPMHAAVALLADMARREWPRRVAVSPGVEHAIPPYDRDALMIEVETLPDWFWPLTKNQPMPAELRAEFLSLWSDALPLGRHDRPHWTLRDVHSPNLIWLPDRQGLKRVGLIDTQDCVLGHPAYDLAALLQDARATIEPLVADRLFDYYCGLRGPSFQRDAFAAAFALFGAQRATKIIGIFARLAARDGKRHYLRHLPRIFTYLHRDLHHASLAPLARWYARHLPPETRVEAA